MSDGASTLYVPSLQGRRTHAAVGRRRTGSSNDQQYRVGARVWQDSGRNRMATQQACTPMRSRSRWSSSTWPRVSVDKSGCGGLPAWPRAWSRHRRSRRRCRSRRCGSRSAPTARPASSACTTRATCRPWCRSRRWPGTMPPIWPRCRERTRSSRCRRCSRSRAGAEQVIRLALRQPLTSDTEAAYRLLITEVPRAVGDGTQGVSFALRLNLPVFVTPEGALPQPSWSLERDGGGARLTLGNEGNAHVRVQQHRAVRGRRGEPCVRQRGWRLCAGRRRAQLAARSRPPEGRRCR